MTPSLTIKKLNEMYSTARSFAENSALLIAAAVVGNASIENINELWDQTASMSSKSALLVFAAATSGKSIGNQFHV